MISAFYVSAAQPHDRMSLITSFVFNGILLVGLTDRFIELFANDKAAFGVFITPVVCTEGVAKRTIIVVLSRAWHFLVGAL
jgi:hypothetical protein